MISFVTFTQFSRFFGIVSFLSYSFRTVTRRVFALTLVFSNFPCRFMKMTSVSTLKDCRMFFTFWVVGTKILVNSFLGIFNGLLYDHSIHIKSYKADPDKNTKALQNQAVSYLFLRFFFVIQFTSIDDA